MGVLKLRQSGWLACVALAIGLIVPAPSRADPLDTVLDVLYKGGVIDGNVHAAKPLISCLASGKNAAECTAGNAQQTELANDPQVQNVLDIYQSFSQHDWYAVLKKAGITVGCALVPGGEVKDVACGELGKIAGQVLDGAGSVVGAVGSFVTSVFGGGSDPPPMSPQDYYTLNYMPWYHWSVVYQLDQNTPANNQILNAPVPACVNYFYHHTYSKDDANKVCGDMRAWLSDNGYKIGNAFRDETDSYYQLHFAPAIEEAAENAFANTSNVKTFANLARLTCLADERKKIPLPSSGLEQCDALKQSLTSMSIPFSGNNIPGSDNQLADQVYAQCQADAQVREVPSDNDAYTRICTPIANRVSGAVIFRMGEIKSFMDAAAAAGCPNDGTPKSIHCDSYAAQVACEQALPAHASMCSSSNGGKAVMDAAAAAGCFSNGTPETIRCGSYETQASCVNAIPEHADLCHLDQIAAVLGNATSIWKSVDADDAHCLMGGKGGYNKIRCVHPLQTVRCNDAKKALGEQWGPDAVQGILCNTINTPEYDQLMQTAQLAVSALNATYPPNPAPTAGCGLQRQDPLAIECDAGFQWDAIPERSDAVYNLLHTTDASGRPNSLFCSPDVDNDGAEAPCLVDAGLPALPPPAMLPQPPQLQPVSPQRPIQQTPATRMRRVLPIIKKDGSGGG